MSRGIVISKLIWQRFYSSSRAIGRHDRSPEFCARAAAVPIFLDSTISAHPPSRGGSTSERLALRSNQPSTLALPQSTHCQRTVQTKVSSPSKPDTPCRAPSCYHACSCSISSQGVPASLLIPHSKLFQHEALHQVLFCIAHSHISLADGISFAYEAGEEPSVYHWCGTCRIDSCCETGSERH